MHHGDLSDLISNASKVMPFQPDPISVNEISAEYFENELPSSSISGNIAVVGGVPFAKYWQSGNENIFLFHPMAWGRHVLNQSEHREYRGKILAVAERIGIPLPNGGLAFYYPNKYPLNRMRGPDMMYSTISQADILSGFLRFHLMEDTDASARMLERIKLSFFLPYEKGGINLADIAQLEMPLFRCNPEIILNGWLHSLLHLSDYAHQTKDPDVKNLIHRNLRFFADHHSAWYDEDRNISCYSDTSPHRVTVRTSREKQGFKLTYKSKATELPDFITVPVEDPNKKLSGYDARVLQRNRLTGHLTMGITCSSLFDTILVSDAPFSVAIRSGGYDPHRATPSASGSLYWIDSSREENFHAATIDTPDGVMRAYPTNFGKANGKNYYHIQHIVAIAQLSAFPAYQDANLDSDLIRIAEAWQMRTRDFKHSGLLEFEDPQKVLDSINRGRTLRQVTDVRDLFSW